MYHLVWTYTAFRMHVQVHQHSLHSVLQHAAITNIFVPETIVSIIPAYVTVITTVETGVTNLTAVSVDIMYPKGCKC